MSCTLLKRLPSDSPLSPNGWQHATQNQSRARILWLAVPLVHKSNSALDAGSEASRDKPRASRVEAIAAAVCVNGNGCRLCGVR